MNDLLMKYILPPIALLGGCTVFYLMVVMQPKPEPVDSTQTAATVKVVEVVAHQGGFTIDVDGVVEPYRDLVLAAEVSGRIQSKNELSRTGHFVKAGTELFQIDPRDYQFEVDRLTELAQQSETELEELKIDHQNTTQLAQLAYEEVTLHENELKRLEQLGRSITDSELDQQRRLTLSAKNRYLTFASQVQILAKRHHKSTSAIRLAQTQLGQAKLNLERTRIVAPIDGLIVDDVVEQEAYVQVGAKLAILEDTSKVEVNCNLRMEELYWLWSQEGPSQTQPGDSSRHYQIPQVPVRVVYELSGRESTKYIWNGILSRSDGIEEKTRTVPCLVRVDRPTDVYLVGDERPAPPALVRGMFVKVQLQVRSPKQLLQISELAIQPGKNIWRVRDGKLNLVKDIELIKLMPTGDGRNNWLVDPSNTDLTPGDSVVVSQLSAAYDGMAVQISSETKQP
jgi:multidrug efflux pump subunit AcrA (membrane-fusion protein)